MNYWKIKQKKKIKKKNKLKYKLFNKFLLLIFKFIIK